MQTGEFYATFETQELQGTCPFDCQLVTVTHEEYMPRGYQDGTAIYIGDDGSTPTNNALCRSGMPDGGFYTCDGDVTLVGQYVFVMGDSASTPFSINQLRLYKGQYYTDEATIIDSSYTASGSPATLLQPPFPRSTAINVVPHTGSTQNCVRIEQPFDQKVHI